MDFFFTIAGTIIFIEALSFYFTKKDTTDPEKGKSGLRVYVDNETGIHYIKSSMFDKLQVRLDENGKPYKEKLDK